MKLAAHMCLFLNRFFPKMDPPGRESPHSYSDMEYRSAENCLSLHAPYIDLKGATVLDAGCGLGGKTVFYAEKGCKSIIGIDMDENHIKYANEFASEKALSNLKFQVGDFGALPFESDRFDIVFLNGVVEHIRRPILIRALEECRRVIKVGGRICLEFPPWTSPRASHLYDYIYIPWCQMLFSSETLIDVLKKMKLKPRAGKLSAIEHFQELNHITIKEFKDIIKKLDFKVINLQFRMTKNLNFLRYVPWLNKYFTGNVIAVLSK